MIIPFKTTNNLAVIGSVSGSNLFYDASGNSNQWNTAYNNSIYTINGTANQIDVANSGNNTGNNSVTLSLPNSAVFPGNVVINGTFTANGSATFINTQNLVVNDNIIYFNQGATDNTLDTGIVSHFTPTGGYYNHTGLVRRLGQGVPGVWTLFSGLTSEPTSNINWSDATLTVDSLSANLIGNVTGNADTVTNGVYTNQTYDDPSWINTLADTKLTGTRFTNYLPLSGGTMSGNLVVNASFAAQTKSFLINHPSEPNKKLQYGSLESPYHGIRLTGKSKISSKQAIVQLPDYIKDLVREDDVNIQLTNINHSKVLYVKSIDVSNNQFVVGVDKKWTEVLGSYEFFWSFTAIRKDVPALEVEV